MELILPIVLIVLSVLLLIIGIISLVKLSKKGSDNSSAEILNRLALLEEKQERELSSFRQELNQTTANSMKSLGEIISNNQKDLNQTVAERISVIDKNLNDKQNALQKTVSDSFISQEQRFKTFSELNEQKLEGIRGTVEKRLSSLQDENSKKLDEMRSVVDEKLQKTLETRMSESFKLVSERLEAVYKGLGEMQTIAANVGDLKKVLSNVKTRGIMGEIQLGAILSEILAPEQYEENVETKKGSGKRVEFAIKLPADDDKFVYLPIDSKFPGDTYQALLDAYDTGDKAQIDAAAKALINRVKAEAKDISTKYISVPDTTEFAILFLPFEGLYSEVVNRGLVEELQKLYKVNIAGPSTMAALLNSLQMGFKTLAIQKRSSEVWEILSAVKTEFVKFEEVITATQKKLNSANDELDKLVGVRTRAINRKLRSVTTLTDSSKSQSLLDMSSDDDDAPDISE